MFTSHIGHVMTLANSIIGVGILAMPFCFEKCGVILSILLLVILNLITRLCCHYLIKASMLTRRKSFEFLAFHAFGSSGKLMVELCIIGYLIGSCIAYFVVVGDLGPQIVAKILNISEINKLRTWIMIIVTFTSIIPLGLLKNVDSLAAVCTASIGFYFCLVLKVIAESKTHIIANDWINVIDYWKPSGVLQCLPIFSMALSCQMQLFEVFENVTNASLEKMNQTVKYATTICTIVYILVGFFGYVAFCNQPFSGNILVNFSPTFVSDAIKMGFVLSIAFSFPLVIFPCRASIYSLLYKRGHVDTTPYIPEFRFKFITISIVLFSLIIAISIPSIELVIGLVGSTIGIGICMIFPAICFMKVSKKNSTEKILAQFILISGLCFMILGTYANLCAIDGKRSGISSMNENLKIIEKITNTKNYSNTNNNNNNNNNLKFKELETFENIENKKLINIKEKIKNDLRSNQINKSDNLEKNNKSLDRIVKLENMHRNMNKILEISKTNEIKNIDIEKTETELNNFNNTLINKDAIKKEDEIVAEENQKMNAQNAEIELKKTKEMFEKKVDELKQQIAKQNEETQNLVAEKLDDIAEKVKEIGRQVQKDDSQDLKSQIDEKKEPKQVQFNEVREPKPMESQLNNVILPKSAIAENNIVPIKDNIEKKNENNNVYEPTSYKLGEAINENKINLEKNNNAVPIAMLLNNKTLNMNIKKNENITSSLKSDIKIQNDDVVKKEDQKKIDLPSESNIEAIRRDILEIITPELQTTIKSIREKRNIDQSSSCVNWDFQLANCLDKTIRTNLLLNNPIDIKTQTFGRDLKSVIENVN